MVIFRDPVTPLQAFGYSIALMGLIYYKLGAEGVRNFLSNSRQAIRGLGIRRLVLLIALTGLAIFGLTHYSQKSAVFSPTILQGLSSKN